MLNGLLEGFEAYAMEGLKADDSAVLESADFESLNSTEALSEVDELRVDETAEVMAEVFPVDVLENWPEMSLDERAAKLDEYYTKAGEKLGIDTKGVIIEPMPSAPGMITMGYNSGDGYIHINEAVVEDPTLLGEVLDTATHEMRHQFQSDALASPENFSDLPQSTLETWEYEMNNYISPDYDPQGYYEQSIECDARDFADNVLRSYVDKVLNDYIDEVISNY